MWDVVVVGGGPAGAVAAYVLARAGRRVALVDAVDPTADKIGESLPSAARRILEALELLGTLTDDTFMTSYGNASAWGSGQLVITDFIRDPYGLAWHLDRPKFDHSLRTAAYQVGAEPITGWIEQIDATPASWQLTCGAMELETRWLLDATGRRAFVARSQGARRLRDVPLVALYAWASAASSPSTLTTVETTPNGWWYTARLPNERRVVAYHVDADAAAEMLNTADRWLAELAQTQHISQAIPNLDTLTPVRGTDAGGAQLSQFVGERWIAAGDAALSFDPLSSQGIFNALYTGMKSGEAVDLALDGRTDALAAYTARLNSVRAAYVQQCRHFYQSERRWLDRPFWSRRRKR